LVPREKGLLQRLEVIGLKTLPRYVTYAGSLGTKKLTGFPAKPIYGPTKAYLEISRTCNLNCPMCMRSATELGFGFMSLETCKKVVDGFDGIIGVGLNGWGEPLLNPNVIQLLRYMSSKGLLIAFNTNGILLKDLAPELINIKSLYHVGLSLDSLTAKKGKGHDSLSVLEGLAELAKLKKLRGKKFPHLRISMTVTNSNVEEMSDLVNAVAKYGDFWFDSHPAISFKQENVDGPFGPPSAIVLKENLEKAAQEGERLGLRVTLDRTDLSTQTNNRKSNDPPCGMPWDSAFIDFKGDVHPCCFHVDRTLGNAAEKPLTKIWKNEQYVKFRQEILGGVDSFCGNCGNCEMWRNYLN
jgi:radical SAM protein with 4Fe4S-binding SPASM domain